MWPQLFCSVRHQFCAIILRARCGCLWFCSHRRIDMKHFPVRFFRYRLKQKAGAERRSLRNLLVGFPFQLETI
jgi:hypothetical protein